MIKEYLQSTVKAREFAQEHKLTNAQLEILLLMHSENRGSLIDMGLSQDEYLRRDIGEIAKRLGLKPSNASSNITGLYRGRNPALLEKYINPYNQRLIALGLTKEGAELSKEAEKYICTR